MQLYSLLYTSAETDEMSEVELQKLLVKSRDYNASMNITGLLLYHKHSFMQVLEGDKAAIEDLYQSKIALDKRHTCIIQYFLSPIDKRTFPKWSMAFYQPQDGCCGNLLGYSDFLKNGFDPNVLKQEPTAIKQMLLMFVGRIPPI